MLIDSKYTWESYTNFMVVVTFESEGKMCTIAIMF